MREIQGIREGNHVAKIQAYMDARPWLGYQMVPSFVVHHDEDCEIFTKSDGECNCDPDIELEKVDYPNC